MFVPDLGLQSLHPTQSLVICHMEGCKEGKNMGCRLLVSAVFQETDKKGAQL